MAWSAERYGHDTHSCQYGVWADRLSLNGILKNREDQQDSRDIGVRSSGK